MMIRLALAAALLQAPPADLGAAVAAASPGDTIRVAAGLWRGPIVVDRPLVLLADPGAVLDGGGKGTIVTVKADSVVIDGLTLVHGGRSLDLDDAAIKVVRCRGCRIRGVRVERAGHGIYLLESHDVQLADNRIVGDRALPEARRGNGIHLFHSTGSRLVRNRIRDTRDGIYFSFASDNRVEGNEVHRVRFGLHYMYSDDNDFRGNRFTGSAAGAAIMFSRRILLRENVFSGHAGSRGYGVLLQTAYDVRAERNRIEGNRVGIFLDMSSGNLFRENRISGNRIGIDLIASAEHNTFLANAITGNHTAVRKPNGAGENHWAAEGRGNFWGERGVFDLDGDGVGDRPYLASDPFASMAALRPVLELFAGTPAARALSWAERAVPVFGFPRVEDPHPLVARPGGVP